MIANFFIIHDCLDDFNKDQPLADIPLFIEKSYHGNVRKSDN